MTNFNVCSRQTSKEVRLQNSISYLWEKESDAIHVITADVGFVYHTAHKFNDPRKTSILRSLLGNLVELSVEDLMKTSDVVERLLKQKQMHVIPRGGLVYPKT